MSWSICGQRLSKGEKRKTVIEPEGLPGYKMPATIICGAKEGKTLVITASIHSGEYPGVPAVIRTAAKLDPNKVCGNILLIHCVNISGFWAKSEARVPEDGGNLNADYPGSPEGGVTAKIAYYFEKEIIPNADFVLDLHSGGGKEPLSTCLFYPYGEKVTEKALEVAKQLDIPYLIRSTSIKGQIGYGANIMGVPGLLLERGHSGHCLEEWIQGYEKDLRQFLRYMGAYDFPKEEVCEKTVCTKTIYLESDFQGLWYPAIKEGMNIKKDQLLGYAEDFYGEKIREYRAVEDGFVHYYTSGLAVCEGDPLVAYSLDSGVVCK